MFEISRYAGDLETARLAFPRVYKNQWNSVSADC